MNAKAVVFPQPLPCDVADCERRGVGLLFYQKCEALIPFGGGSEYVIPIPDQFWYDGASIPWWARWLIGDPLAPEFRWAALVHDILCDNSETYQDREVNDSLFLFVLYRSHVSGWRRRAMWLAVRFNSRFLWRPVRCDSFTLSGSLLRQLSRWVPRWLRRR